MGIVGLPNVGKSTLFKALTRQQVAIAAYPFTTINYNEGMVAVPDERLEKIAKIIKPEKVTQTLVKFVDIAGLVKGAHKGEGLGNQFLSHIRTCDAILEVVRAFEKQEAENTLGEINPEKEIGVVNTELLMKDLGTLEKLTQRAEEDLKKDKKNFKELALFQKIKRGVSQGELISELNLTDEEKIEIKEYQFLTQKPILYLLNTGQQAYSEEKTEKSLAENIKDKKQYLQMNLQDEVELSLLSSQESAELGLPSQLDQLIINCYNILDLITFYTIVGGKEVRAWTLKKGMSSSEAAGVVHSDFKERFIRAEVISSEDLIKAGSLARARESGLIKTAGKEYVLRDGDIIEFKI